MQPRYENFLGRGITKAEMKSLKKGFFPINQVVTKNTVTQEMESKTINRRDRRRTPQELEITDLSQKVG